MRPERWRLFVAVPVGEELRRKLAAAVEGWKKRPDLARLRWTDPEAWHVTLAFLGSIDVARAGYVAATSARVAEAHQAMRAATGGVGGFPSAARARVAWYGVRDEGRSLRRIAQDLRTRLDLDASEPFRAHITLGRARLEPVDLRPWRAEASAPEGELVVDRLELMRTLVGREPSSYEIIASARLGDV